MFSHILRMKRFSMFLCALTACLLSFAQTTSREVKRHPAYSGGKFCPYYTVKAKPTPAPDGYKPFYISHYGRHGSRYMTTNKPYEELLPIMEKAEKAGALSRRGRSALKKLRVAYADAKNRAGELTALGGRQHEGIAHRMYENYPEVFGAGSYVDARSTQVGRCRASMLHFCGELKRLSPMIDLHVRTDKADGNILGISRDSVKAPSTQKSLRQRVKLYRDSLKNHVDMAGRVFRSESEADRFVKDRLAFSRAWYFVGADVRNVPELHLNFDRLLTPQQKFLWWQDGSLDWVLDGGYMAGDAPRYRNQRNMLRNVINWADDVIRSGSKGASLRFGHDCYLLPLAYLMGMEGMREFPADKIATMYRYFADFKVTPMACNIQLIFYKKQGSDDILVKALLNERETTIPIASDCAPFYHWNDLKAYFLKRLSE